MSVHTPGEVKAFIAKATLVKFDGKFVNSLRNYSKETSGILFGYTVDIIVIVIIIVLVVCCVCFWYAQERERTHKTVWCKSMQHSIQPELHKNSTFNCCNNTVEQRTQLSEMKMKSTLHNRF